MIDRKTDEKLTEREVSDRVDRALRRMISTPPKPHDPAVKYIIAGSMRSNVLPSNHRNDTILFMEMVLGRNAQPFVCFVLGFMAGLVAMIIATP